MPRHAALVPLVVLSLATASPALAAPASEAGPTPEANQGQDQVRYQRPGAATGPRVRTDALDQRLEQAKQTQRAENEAIEQARANDFHRRHQEAREQALIDEQISLLTRLIKATDTDDLEMADLLFRLADLYLEKKAYFELQAGSLYEKITEAEGEE